MSVVAVSLKKKHTKTYKVIERVGEVLEDAEFIEQKRIRSLVFFFFQAEDGIRALYVTGVQTCALPIFAEGRRVYFGQGGWSGAHLIAYGLLLIAVVLFLPQGAYPALRRLWIRVAKIGR